MLLNKLKLKLKKRALHTTLFIKITQTTYKLYILNKENNN